MSLPDEPSADALRPTPPMRSGVLQEGVPQQPPPPVETDAPEPEPEGLSAEEIARHQKIAEFNAHPHTQLTKLAADLRSPTALDVNGRLGIVHQAVARLVGLMLQGTEPPQPLEPQEAPHEGQRHAQGLDG